MGGEDKRKERRRRGRQARRSSQVPYQWSRFFINAYGQFSRFHFKDDGVKGTLRDWYINASIGVRF